MLFVCLPKKKRISWVVKIDEKLFLNKVMVVAQSPIFFAVKKKRDKKGIILGFISSSFCS
jgi:hypothetical protein